MAKEGEASSKTIPFEEGWPVLQDAINKLIDSLEGVCPHTFTPEEKLNRIVYNMCGKPIGPQSQKLYDEYKKSFEDYISSKSTTIFKEKKDENLVQELVKRWNNHKTSFMTFYELVYGEMNDQVRDVVISMVDQEREGEEIDQALVKNVLDIYTEMGEGSMKYYQKDFDEAMLADTAAIYSPKASIWITSESYKDYMLKVEGCLK
ncbi:unnamed protein product [Camellia sinensis]